MFQSIASRIRFGVLATIVAAASAMPATPAMAQAPEGRGGPRVHLGEFGEYFHVTGMRGVRIQGKAYLEFGLVTKKDFGIDYPPPFVASFGVHDGGGVMDLDSDVYITPDPYLLQDSPAGTRATALVEIPQLPNTRVYGIYFRANRTPSAFDIP